MTTPADVHPKLPDLLRKLHSEQTLLRKLDRYYSGTQPLSFLAPEIQRRVRGRLRNVVVNWPRLIVNSIEERLDVDGFRMAGNRTPDADLWAIWQANDLDEYSQMCHLDSMVHHIAYAIVWENPDNPKIPKITVESAEQVTVELEPGTLNVTAAVKHWVQDDVAYATLYLDDVLYPYDAPATSGTFNPTSAAWSLREEPIPHPYGVVPVVPFVNRPRLTNPYGESELHDVVPLADGINKLATDMMVSAEFHATVRRWMTGVAMEGDEEGSEARIIEILKKRYSDALPGNVWTSDSDNAKFGQFQEADLQNFVTGIEMFAAQIAAIAGLPPHYVGLMSQANPASADAIRSAEASLVKRAERKQGTLGGGWERVMRLALLVRDGVVPDAAHAMETIWRDPRTTSLAQTVDAAVKLDGIGMPLRQTLEDTGRTPTEVDRIMQIRNDDALKLVEAQLQAADVIVEKFGFSRAAALAAVGLEAAAKVEAIVEARSPGPGVINDAELAAEVAAATPVVTADGTVAPSRAAIKPDPAPQV